MNILRAVRWARMWAIAAATTAAITGAAWAQEDEAEDTGGTPWPAEIKGHVPVQPGEHPRLFFRKTDLLKLRQRAATPEGQAIISRLRVLLNGFDGETMPPRFGMNVKPASDGSGPLDSAPPGVYTFSHTAGYGLLYQLTGNKRYADLARQCMDKAFEGYRDRDQRYSFKQPFGALRAGPALGWTALGYDLCYDGWDEAYRQKVAQAIQNYSEGQWCSLEELTRGARQHPGSNHWGMQVGGAAMALLAIVGDPGVDKDKIDKLLEVSKKSMIINMTKGFGDGGFFAEGDGTGSMSSHIVFLPALQAWKNVLGLDFVSPRPNAQWMALKWIFLTIPRGGNMEFQSPKDKGRGGYPHNVWARGGKSGAGYFSMGFGTLNEDQQAALLWFYNRHLLAVDVKNNTPFDVTTPYAHHAVLSLANWPFGMKEKNPGDVLPHAYRDTKWSFYAWRNRWHDENDIVISILTRAAKGNMGAPAEKSLTIWAMGKKLQWGNINQGFTGQYNPAPDGSTVLTTGDDSCLAIDFSGLSGADGMLVMTGPGAPADNLVEVGDNAFSFLFLTRDAPPVPKVVGNKITVGKQTVSFDGKAIVLGK